MNKYQNFFQFLIYKVSSEKFSRIEFFVLYSILNIKWTVVFNWIFLGHLFLWMEWHSYSWEALTCHEVGSPLRTVIFSCNSYDPSPSSWQHGKSLENSWTRLNVLYLRSECRTSALYSVKSNYRIEFTTLLWDIASKTL